MCSFSSGRSMPVTALRLWRHCVQAWDTLSWDPPGHVGALSALHTGPGKGPVEGLPPKAKVKVKVPQAMDGARQEEAGGKLAAGSTRGSLSLILKSRPRETPRAPPGAVPESPRESPPESPPRAASREPPPGSPRESPPREPPGEPPPRAASREPPPGAAPRGPPRKPPPRAPQEPPLESRPREPPREGPPESPPPRAPQESPLESRPREPPREPPQPPGEPPGEPPGAPRESPLKVPHPPPPRGAPAARGARACPGTPSRLRCEPRAGAAPTSGVAGSACAQQASAPRARSPSRGALAGPALPGALGAASGSSCPAVPPRPAEGWPCRAPAAAGAHVPPGAARAPRT
ncbi:basic proline-rich protein-like [Talpa occidentalis]|uniref:basic proline-rich protein-like n=1 Tax=Talpa occidentalis TaxID=50954 RepID=UPI00188E1A8B|nr:basic proline-rich protein-like [Talpa occidentalis]